MKISKITRSKYAGKVYNFGVSPNHNYFTNGLLVHNCYQGSTKAGTHASIDDIKRVIRTLSEYEVFEIAYGGGEPTTHPNFIEILEHTKAHHIIPNFTTKNIKWLHENLGNISDIIGSVAYSVQHATDIKTLATIRDFYSVRHHKVCAQFVMGTQHMSTFERIVEECSTHGVPLTLLGFKRQHRGIKYKTYDYSNWFDVIEKMRKEQGMYCKIGVDTALVQESQEILKANVPDWLYHKDEGTFSWYIDAVDKQMGPSSYHELTPYANIWHDLDEQYGKYNNDGSRQN